VCSIVPADAVEGVRCNYLPSQDRVVFISDKAVGARRDLNGVLLLDSALQTTVSKPDDVVCVELTLPDVSNAVTCSVARNFVVIIMFYVLFHSHVLC
jgi:baculoviral IAP repeat-containing protein 6 (apollon)